MGGAAQHLDAASDRHRPAILTAAPASGRANAMRKHPENRTAREEIASVIDWADRQGFAHAPAIAALRHQPTPDTVRAAIQWADQQGFRNIAAALRERGLDL
jgi:hypothetical protein